jgi:hypothetical protein
MNGSGEVFSQQNCLASWKVLLSLDSVPGFLISKLHGGFRTCLN